MRYENKDNVPYVRAAAKVEQRAASKPTPTKSSRPTHRAPAPSPKRGFHRPRNRG